MKTTMRRLILTLACLVALPGLLHAQTSITTFTITEPVTTPSPTSINLTVSATTGMAVNGVLYLDGSVYRVTSISGLVVGVITVYRPATHLDNAGGFVVPIAAQVGLNPIGSCIRSTAGPVPQYSPYTLHFNLGTGDISYCAGASGSRTWVTVNPYGVGSKSADPPQTP